ncbi:hypothetical protein M9H77_34027 [Catharanthus roseus]|uniref:Uncharacterized protein n=1 Tax=Catharanthus roseus TaxID=4058 RepID=A0ACB9ZK25_CATRO|nr:hypothetical protein M9H77_34027 [Catharanthus roseus]
MLRTLFFAFATRIWTTIIGRLHPKSSCKKLTSLGKRLYVRRAYSMLLRRKWLNRQFLSGVYARYLLIDCRLRQHKTNNNLKLGSGHKVIQTIRFWVIFGLN